MEYQTFEIVDRKIVEGFTFFIVILAMSQIKQF